MVCVFVSAEAQTINIEQDTAAVNYSGANIDARGKKPRMNSVSGQSAAWPQSIPDNPALT